MRPEDLSVVLRERNGWEASDLGIAIVRQHAGTIFAAWALWVLPIMLLIIALSTWFEAFTLGALLMWWLKPVYDRVPLYVISRATFGAVPSLRQTLRAQLKIEWRVMLAWLTWRRLSPNRALLLPVDLLEGVNGERRRTRATVIRGSATAPAMVTIIAFHLEVMVVLSLLTLSLMFVPVEFFSDSLALYWETLIETPPPWADALLMLLGAIAISLVEPFYVGAGFAQYLSRRTQLEAWDIELEFRKLAARLGALASTLLLLVLLLPAGAQAAPTDEKAAPPPLEEQLGKYWQAPDPAWEEQIAALRNDALLHPKRTVSAWRLRDPAKPKDEPAAEKSPLPSWLGAGIGWLARAAVWLLGLVALSVLTVYLWRHRARWWRFPVPAQTPIADLAAPLEALPDDISAAVRAHLRNGEQRAALALLYRAARLQLVQHTGREMASGTTEAGVKKFAKRHAPNALSEAIGQIVGLWLVVAYAHRAVAASDIEAALDQWLTSSSGTHQ